VLLLAALTLVVLLGLIWIMRDRIAVALMAKEIQRRGPLQKIPLPAVDASVLDPLRKYLADNRSSPEEYILSKFDDHDIVFVGEHHRIKHDVEFIHRLIPLLHARGVYNLGVEFANHEDQGLIDSLVASDAYDESIANRILFNHSVMWGYQEYADIFRAAWRLNRGLPAGARPFRVVGLNERTDWSHVRSVEDLHNEEVMAKVWPGGPGDEFMAETVLREFVERHEKALIYCGLHHAFTQFKQPKVLRSDGTVAEFFDRRLGHLVFDRIGERAMTIAMHASWPGRRSAGPLVYPVDGVIDALMKTVDPAHRKVGFDTRGTPFGLLKGETTSYGYGLEEFTLGDFCDGYVFQAPFSQSANVRLIPAFINRGNVDEAKRRCANPRFRTGFWRFLGSDFMNEMIALNGNVEDRFAPFEW
jgi:hypothetical protein